MKKVGLIFVGMLVLAIALGVGQSQATVCDLTSPGATCTNPFSDGVNFEQITLNPVGTGTFYPFLRIQAQPTEAGYNTDAATFEATNDAKDDGWTRAIQLGQLGTINVGGIDYYRLDLDINEQNNTANHLLTLNTVELYLSSSAVENSYASGLGTLIYDMQAGGTPPNSVELDFDLEAGSGWGDMSMFIPTSLFTGQALTQYLYLYSEFGDPNTSGDGFEEWRFLGGGSIPPPPPPPVPEPSTLFLLGGGLIGLGALRKKFKK